MDEKEKITEVMKALTALGYPSGSEFALEPIDDRRCGVIHHDPHDKVYDHCIGIYDFEKHISSLTTMTASISSRRSSA